MTANDKILALPNLTVRRALRRAELYYKYKTVNRLYNIKEGILTWILHFEPKTPVTFDQAIEFYSSLAEQLVFTNNKTSKTFKLQITNHIKDKLKEENILTFDYIEE